MARIPRSDEPPAPRSDVPETGEEPLHINAPTEASAEIEDHIRNVDFWADDWRLNELEFDSEPRQAEHRLYLAALRKLCLDYSNQVLREFPLGAARWLAQEAENVCDGLPSQILKRSQEAVRTPDFAQRNQFELLREEWEGQSHNPALILQALSLAKELGVFPPDWVLGIVIDAGAKAYKSGGDLGFDEALGLTPGKIKEARSAQKKVWIADLVAEAVDAGLKQADARELAVFEVEYVYGWGTYTLGTVQKYYELDTSDREGFSQSFMYSLGWYGFRSDPVYQSFRLPYWRRKVLEVRLAAYREAYEFFPETGDIGLDRAQRLPHVVRKTVESLRRNQPPKNSLTGR
jgi:hypothetical protein